MDRILDEGLDEKEVSHAGIIPLGIILIIIGIFLLLNSYHSFQYLSNPHSLLVLIPPSMYGAISSLTLGGIILINGFLLYRKKEKSYYLLATIISIIFIDSLILLSDNISVETGKMFEGIILGILGLIPFLFFNIVLIIFLNYHKTKLTNIRLLHNYIILGIIVGLIPFLLKNMI